MQWDPGGAFTILLAVSALSLMLSVVHPIAGLLAAGVGLYHVAGLHVQLFKPARREMEAYPVWPRPAESVAYSPAYPVFCLGLAAE